MSKFKDGEIELEPKKRRRRKWTRVVNEDGTLDKKRAVFLNDDVQYRFKHFHMKDGVLYYYRPKQNNVTLSIFNLYCWKTKCPGKIRVDMFEETAYEISEHDEHRRIYPKEFKNEFPELMEKGWEHIQYDILNGEKILMWKH